MEDTISISQNDIDEWEKQRADLIVSRKKIDNHIEYLNEKIRLGNAVLKDFMENE